MQPIRKAKMMLTTGTPLIVEVAELPRDVVVTGEGEREARARGRVQEAGTARRDRGVDVQEHREPASAHRGREAGEGTGEPRERDLVPPFREVVGTKSAQEGDLQECCIGRGRPASIR